MASTNPELLQVLVERQRQAHQLNPAEWAVRVELAACYRLLAHFRMTNWVYNQISARVPGSHGHYLINAFGSLYEEVSASHLVKVDMHGKLVDDVPLDVNPAAFVIHGAIHTATRRRLCAAHAHRRWCGGVGAGRGAAANFAACAQVLRQGGLLQLRRHRARTGRAATPGARRRRQECTDPAYHSLLTMGVDVAEAFKEMLFLDRTCQVQIAALAGGGRLCLPLPDVCERTAGQFTGDTAYLQGRDWRALLPLLDRTDPTYKE